jgi:hypothetical protein
VPQLTFPFDLNGLYVDVLVSCGGARMRELAGQNIPILPPIWTRGVIDTGSNVSAVSLALLGRLSIPRGKAAKSEGISGLFETHFYEVSLTIAVRSALTGPDLLAAGRIRHPPGRGRRRGLDRPRLVDGLPPGHRWPGPFVHPGVLTDSKGSTRR